MKRLFLLLFSILPGLLFADNISVEKAQTVAMKFMQSCGIPQTRSEQLRMAWDGESRMTRGQQEPAFYVFDLQGGQKGFVIVAADDRAMPILGYSFETGFDERNIPLAMRGHLNDYRKEINHLRQQNAVACEEARQAWKEASTVNTRSGEQYDKNVHGNILVQYETAKWDQDEPYNRFCPTIRGQRTYSGCQITSICILMRYFQWPDKGVGTVPGYYCQQLNQQIKSVKLGHEYHWEKMPLEYKKNQYSKEEGDLVARIMSDFGVMIRAEYGTAAHGGTGAIPQDVPAAMFTYLKYDKSMVYRPRDYYGLDLWMDMLKSELDRCPILYTGADDSGKGGHAFVFDGYTDNDFFHTNWGWSGSCDGWYKISALAPTEQGAGGNNGNFNVMQGASFNMKPDEGGKRVGADIKYLSNFQWKGRYWYGLKALTNNITTGTPFKAEAGIFYNIGDETIRFKLSLWLCDRNGNRKEQLKVTTPSGTSDVINVGPMDPWANAGTIPDMSMTITSPLEKGDRVRAFYEKDGEWEVITGTTDKADDGKPCSFEIVCGEDAPADVDIEKTTSVKYDKATKVLTLSVKRGVSIKVMDASGKDVTSASTTVQGSRIAIDGKKLSAGSYTIRLTSGDITKEFKYTVGSSK